MTKPPRLRRKKKKELLEKITQYIGKKIAYLTNVDGWTQIEISGVSGVPQNRISEYVHHDTHRRPVSESHLRLFLQSEIVLFIELEKRLELSEIESGYLRSLLI